MYLYPSAPTVLSLGKTCPSCLVNTTSPHMNLASKSSPWNGTSSTRTTATRRLTTTSHSLNSRMTSCSQTTSALSAFLRPTSQLRRYVSRPDGEPPVNTFPFFVTTEWVCMWLVMMMVMMMMMVVVVMMMIIGWWWLRLWWWWWWLWWRWWWWDGDDDDDVDEHDNGRGD